MSAITDRAKEWLDFGTNEWTAEELMADLLAEVERLEKEENKQRQLWLDDSSKLLAQLDACSEYFNVVEMCCCGQAVDKHGYYDGHSPVSMLDHHVECRVKERTKELQAELSRYRSGVEVEGIISTSGSIYLKTSAKNKLNLPAGRLVTTLVMPVKEG